MNRPTALAFFTLAAWGCSQPEPAAHAVVQPESPARPVVAAATAPAVLPAPMPSGTPTPQPAEPHVQAVAAAAPGQPGSRHFGTAIDPTAQTVRLGQILAAPQQFEAHPIRVEGQVVAVCQHMGCWMEIRDEATQAHVRMHGHSFFVPRDVNGHRAAVEGTLVAAHPPTECDHTAHAATGQVAQVELDAVGVDVFD
jgi:hypothetical protein